MGGEKENEGGDDMSNMSILDKMKLKNQIEMWLISLPHFGCGGLDVHWKIG